MSVWKRSTDSADRSTCSEQAVHLQYLLEKRGRINKTKKGVFQLLLDYLKHGKKGLCTRFFWGSDIPLSWNNFPKMYPNNLLTPISEQTSFTHLRAKLYRQRIVEAHVTALWLRGTWRHWLGRLTWATEQSLTRRRNRVAEGTDRKLEAMGSSVSLRAVGSVSRMTWWRGEGGKKT